MIDTFGFLVIVVIGLGIWKALELVWFLVGWASMVSPIGNEKGKGE